MSLTPYEKRALFRFLAVYFGAVAIIVVAFGMLLIRIESESLLDHIKSTLRMQAQSIAFGAIDAQMLGKKFSIDSTISYQLYDHDKKLIRGNFKDSIALQPGFIQKDGCLYLVDRGAKGHMGIEYIVVKDCSLQKDLQKILYKNSLIALVAFLFLLVIGWYLGRLFLRPLNDYIDKLDRFIKDSTHELNTPVTTIILALSKIENKSRYIDIAKMSARRISKIYEDLTYKNFGASGEMERFDVATLIKELLEFFELLRTQKHLHFTLTLTPCLIEANKKEIEILLKNLIDNAIKYAPANSTISIELRDCRFRIANSCKGLSQKDLARIYDRFERADSSTGGFGLGLSIVKDIANKYGYALQTKLEDGEIIFVIDFGH